MPTPPPPSEPQPTPSPSPAPAHPPAVGHPALLGQVSPWRDPTHGILMTFTLVGSSAALVRVMVTNQNPNLVGSHYALNNEYWYAAREFPSGQRLAMTFAHAPWTLAETDSLVADLPQSFFAPQNAQGLWRSSPYVPAAGLVCYRFTAQDPDQPDDPRVQIGLMLVFDPTLGLCRIVWYKSSNPTTGYVWHDASSPVNGLLWTPTASLQTLSWNFAQGR